jgi:SAM-dependent methyltransferase
MRHNTDSDQKPADFYDERHSRGWMDYWAHEKVNRVLSLVEDALPSSCATVIEYGCGTGTFTSALKRRFPDLDAHGCDISPKGVEKARVRCPGATFHLLYCQLWEPPLPQADLIYTHHVLEHVDDVDAVLADIARQLKPGGRVLHVMPCGNTGSVEYWLASRMRNGIAQDGTGLLCMDDISHVRRLTSAQLEHFCAKHGLVTESRYFANQFWGGWEYIAGQPYWNLLLWLNPTNARNLWSAFQLCALLTLLLPISVLRKTPVQVLGTLFQPRPIWKKALFFLLAPLCSVAYPFSKALDIVLIRIREWEWKRHKTRPNGTEMYLTFVNNAPGERYECKTALHGAHV